MNLFTRRQLLALGAASALPGLCFGQVPGRLDKITVAGWSKPITEVMPLLVEEDKGFYKAQGIELVDLETLFRQADFVSVNAPLTPETAKIVNREHLALMKPSAFLINTARGPIVDEAALLDALKSSRIAGAGLDVFDREPLPAGHPLTTLPNVVLTPHIGWPTDDGYRRFADAACDVLLAYARGEDVPVF